METDPYSLRVSSFSRQRGIGAGVTSAPVAGVQAHEVAG